MGKQRLLPGPKSDTPLTDADERREVAYIAKRRNLQYRDVLTVYREAVSIHPFPSRNDRIAFTEKLLNYQKMTERKLRANPPIPRAPYKIRVKPEDGALDITFFPPQDDSFDDIRTALEGMRDTEFSTVL
ncbi:MAG: hypothetical protein MUF61_03360, partial [archaeon]|nr:hypothetical protein [archaeon]